MTIGTRTTRRMLVAMLLVGTLPALPADADTVSLNFADTTALSVDAASLDLRNEDKSPHDYPYVGSESPVPYDKAFRDWAHERFSLNGQSVNALRITMTQGNITEKLLPVKTGIAGWFRHQQGAEYKGTLAIEVALVDANGKVLASADGSSWASESVAENATQSEKEKAWLDVTKRTFDNLDTDLIPRLRQSLAAYMK